ncbi:MAG: ABC transporter permease [Oscillospiraceae bacterium]|nr:ABC transporter permease [Oscillospiraceae bacterium]
MKRLSDHLRRTQHLPLLVTAAGLALLSAAGFVLLSALGGLLQSQQAAVSFRGESGLAFAQVSAFFPAGTDISETEVYAFRDALEEKLTGESLEAPENGSLYMDAYSAAATVTVESEKAQASVTARGVGGDFFHFHPLRLRAGRYLLRDDLMHDTVLLDEELAWMLFGGVELEGMTIRVNDTPYRVAGVVAREDDFASTRALAARGSEDGGLLFMAWDALNAAVGAPIDTYELVSANPIENFAYSALEEEFPDAVLQENSGRFGFLHILQVLGAFGTRAMQTAAVAYPDWENAARLVEDVMAAVLLLSLLCAVLPALLLLAAAVRLLRRAVRTARVRLPVLAEEYHTRRYHRRQTAERGG